MAVWALWLIIPERCGWWAVSKMEVTEIKLSFICVSDGIFIKWDDWLLISVKIDTSENITQMWHVLWFPKQGFWNGYANVMLLNTMLCEHKMFCKEINVLMILVMFSDSIYYFISSSKWGHCTPGQECVNYTVYNWRLCSASVLDVWWINELEIRKFDQDLRSWDQLPLSG